MGRARVEEQREDWRWNALPTAAIGAGRQERLSVRWAFWRKYETADPHVTGVLAVRPAVMEFSSVLRIPEFLENLRRSRWPGYPVGLSLVRKKRNLSCSLCAFSSPARRVGAVASATIEH
jgi:hypothetical protein